MTLSSPSTAGTEVALVLDDQFGSQVQTVGPMPIWIISSPANDSAATDARTRGLSVTVLLPVASEGPLETLRRALADIEDHHGQHTTAPYEVLVIYGVESSLISQTLARDFGFKGVTSKNGRIFFQGCDSGMQRGGSLPTAGLGCHLLVPRRPIAIPNSTSKRPGERPQG